MPNKYVRFITTASSTAGPVLSDAVVEELSEQLDQILAKGPLGFADDEPQPLLFRDLAKLGDDTPTGDASAAPVWQITNIWEAAPRLQTIAEPSVHRPGNPAAD